MATMTITGNLTKDVYFKEGEEVKQNFCSFTVAFQTDYRDKESTMFVPVKCFGYTAKDSSNLKKGSKVVVTGRPYKDVWSKDDGTEVVSMGVIADEVGRIVKFNSEEENKEEEF